MCTYKQAHCLLHIHTAFCTGPHLSAIGRIPQFLSHLEPRPTADPMPSQHVLPVGTIEKGEAGGTIENGEAGGTIQ